MALKRCSNLVEARVEHAVRDTESCTMHPSVEFRNSPGAQTLGARALLITTRCHERDVFIDEFDGLSNDHIIASASGNARQIARATVYAPRSILTFELK